jgi:transposase
VAAVHARTTDSLTESHRDIGFALGGEAGARLAEKLAMRTSPDTLLRRVKSAPDEPAPLPRYVGVDDWSLRKGQQYGTILIDLERHCVIDVLPGRDGEALKQWLSKHPQVEVIARDRWTAYAKAATEAAPQAQQVADRWHLLKNLREAVERLLARHPAEIRQAAQTENPATASPPSPTADGATPPVGANDGSAQVPEAAAPPTERAQTQAARRRARAERHKLVRGLHAQGRSLRQIAKQLKMSFRTVMRYVREPVCPDWEAGRPRPSQLDEHRAFIADWIAQGGRNAAELHRLLKARGCPIKYSTTCRYAGRLLGSAGRPGPRPDHLVPPAPCPPSARKLSFAFLCPAARDGDAGRAVLDQMRAGVPGLGTALDLAAEFAAMIRKTVAQPLSVWLAKVAACGVHELKTFAAGLRDDEAAVAAALTEPWSSGQVEGQVNRLKLIKRTGYGRASLPLLRARVRRKG